MSLDCSESFPFLKPKLKLRHFQVHIDTAASSTGGTADYEVTFRVSELGRVAGSVNLLAGNQEGSMLTGVRFPNFAGGGERAQVCVRIDFVYGDDLSEANNTFFKIVGIDNQLIH